MKIITSLLAFCLVAGCNKASHNEQVPGSIIVLEELVNPTDTLEGQRDVRLKIVNEAKTDSTRIYTVRALYKKDTVGFKLQVHSTIGGGFTNGSPSRNGFVANGATFIPTGNESNHFINALAQLYGYTDKVNFKKPVSVITFNLNETVVDLNKASYYKLKIFFEGEHEDDYAEAYLNINTGKNEVEFFEKDPEYRDNIIKAFSKQ